DFTKGFISLLETGRTRVSLRAAEILAQRLGVSSADLIAGGDGEADLELALLRAEQQLSAGRAVDAIEVLERLANKATGSLRARAFRARGRSRVRGPSGPACPATRGGCSRSRCTGIAVLHVVFCASAPERLKRRDGIRPKGFSGVRRART